MKYNGENYETFESRLSKLKEEKKSLNTFNIEKLKSNLIRPKQEYSIYQSLSEPYEKSNYEEWLFITKNIENTLKYLLSAPLQRFWSHVVYDNGFSKFITGFFQHIERPYDIFKRLNSQMPKITQTPLSDLDKNSSKIVNETKNVLSNLFFCLLVRMSTRKENKESYIPENVFGDILYENYIFDLPRMLDICSIYAPCNQTLVQKMISNIFHLQPKYLEDVILLAQTLPQMFASVYEKCGFNVASSTPAKLPSNFTNHSEMSQNAFEDLLLYILDTSYCLRNFFETYPPAAKVFNVDSLLSKIASFYENICFLFLPQLEERNDSRCDDVFSQCRINWLHVCQLILHESTLRRLFEESVEVGEKRKEGEIGRVEEVEEIVEGYLSNITSFLEHKRFLADYFLMFAVEADRRVIEQSAYVLDSVRMEYLTDAIEAALDHYSVSWLGGFEGGTGRVAGGSGVVGGAANNTPSFNDGMTGIGGTEGLSSEEMMCKITSIQDLLPDVGSSFLYKCLQQYDTEELLNLLLEDKLPPHLASLDRAENLTEGELERGSRRKEEEMTEGGVLLAMRKNVFDNDEFDVFNNPESVDTSKVFYGKKNKLGGLEDKSDLKELKPIFDIYGNEFTEGSYYEQLGKPVKGVFHAGIHNPLDYEDEYDDAFDELEVAAADNDSAEDFTSRKFDVRPLNARLGRNESKGGNDEDDEDDDGPKMNKNSVNFIEDPAVLRERAAQRRAIMHQNRYPQAATPRDVKGAPKGQGQSDGVLKDRHYKEKNKSFRGNHNRKNLAGKKNQIF